MPWLTPDGPIPTAKICRLVRIPDDIFFIGDVNGALLALTQQYNWEEEGTLTPEECADAMFDMWNDFTNGMDWCMTGAIFPYASVDLPGHSLACDGATYLRVDYPALYAALDPAFIVDADHFVTPDLRSRVPVGVDPTGTPPFNVGDIGGEVSHVLTVAELANHSHIDSGHSHSESSTIPTAITIGPGAPAPSAVGAPGVTGSGSASIQPAGSDNPHNNLQPYIALRYAIMYE